MLVIGPHSGYSLVSAAVKTASSVFYKFAYTPTMDYVVRPDNTRLTDDTSEYRN